MKKIKYTLLVLLIGAMQSCDYLDLSPVDSYGISNYWSTKDQAERFVRGLHYRVRERQEVLFKMGELRGGTFYNSNSSLFNQTISDVPAVTNNLSEANYVINNWGNFYMDIMQINHAIQSVPGSSALNETEKNYYLGVLHGLRSFYYFHLFRTYGGVPLIETARVMDGSFTPSDLNQPRATEEEVYEAARKARCYDFIMALPDGFQTVVGEGGATLSGGEKQRISIARCILKDAPIVILDEATASVDTDNESYIQEAISELVKGKTLLVIAHRLNTIQNADQILVIDNGQIAQQGTHEELLKQSGIYQDFVNIRKSAAGWSLA